ncbi:crossover junction endodeoxyribonuclease RuvC [Desulfitispora alkaliphila]|uniref:crossover junction endodeoxyribonuclease RuvC n=1 Tax=Desulfitispora alkaliphila TaxID=622674 RepID=UPI003D1DD5BB
MLILGIDPGTAITGYGVIELKGNKFSAIDYGAIKTKANVDLQLRLKDIYIDLNQLIDTYKPDHLAVEELFFNKNVRTALSVGHARGVILLAGANHNLVLGQYTPLQVKQAVVGYGRAEKGQVQQMVKNVLGLPKIPKPDDVADALAVAICHAHSYKLNYSISSMEEY